MTNEKAIGMKEAAIQIKEMLIKRMSTRIEALNRLEDAGIDNQPEEVKKWREVQATINRSVIQEQKDLVEMINIMFPNGKI